MWTAPRLQEFETARVEAIAIICTAFDAAARDRCQDGFRDTSSEQVCDGCPPLDPAECLASGIDRSRHLPLEQASATACGEDSPHAELGVGQVSRSYRALPAWARPPLTDGGLRAPCASRVKAGRWPPPKAARSGLDAASAALQCRSGRPSFLAPEEGYSVRR